MKIVIIVIIVAALVCMTLPAMADPPTPFVLDGCVNDSNGNLCNDPAVRVTNATSASWDARNSSASNYYRLVLDSDDVSESDVLNISATYGTSTNTTDHAITTDEINAGGFFDFNFTLESTGVATISIGNVSGNAIAPIVIENAANVGSADITLTYNASVCRITDVANGTFDWTFSNLEHNETGWVRIGAIHTGESGLCGSIILANVTFGSNSTSGASQLNLSVTTLKDATNNTTPIPYIVKNATYTSVLNGDVNGDDVVDIADAMYLAKHILGKAGFEVILEEAADVDGVDGIDLADAMYLAKHVIGKAGFEELR